MNPMVPRMRSESTLPRVVIPELEPIRFEDGKTASVLSLNESMCKYPIGDPTDASFAFCGRGSAGGPYCADHARLAYQPSQAKKRRVSAPDELRRLTRFAM
jgi:GcrA cell cycle regulator